MRDSYSDVPGRSKRGGVTQVSPSGRDLRRQALALLDEAGTHGGARRA